MSTTAVFGLNASAACAQANPAAAASAPAPQASSTIGETPEAAEATPPQANAQQAQDIVVTGSRIVRDGYQSPTPLSVIGAEQLATSTSPNIAQYVTNLPVFAGSSSGRSSTTTGANGTSGINSLNLRSLGPNRTLVLLDGHRVTPAVALGYVDVNALPQALISRVDVVTGGASAAYGSDAVAGVVNFVLNRSMTGLTGEVSSGITNYGDNESYKANLAGGVAFADGRGHILAAVERAYEAGIDPGARSWTRRGRQLLANPAYTATNGQPQRLVYDNIGYMTSAPGGVVSSGPLRGTGFGPGGQVYALNFGDIQADPFMRGGGWQANDLRPTNAIAPEEKRSMAFGRASFEVSRALNFYAQGSYVKSQTDAVSTTSYMIGSSGPLIQLDNAYLPASVRARMVAAGVTSIRVGTLNYDLGLNNQTTQRIATSYTAGADGKFDMLGGSWDWDAYGQYGQSKNHVSFPTNISRSHYTLATDAVRTASGAIVCRSTLTNPANGCVPYNALGTEVNDPNGAAVAYIRSPSISDLKVEQTVVAASLSGEPFSTWAGPVSVAFSAEYRKDKAFGTVDADSLATNHIYANYAPIDGSTNVKEAAFETVVPLAKDKSWADSLELNGAARYTKYSLAGSVTTWKAGVTYSPIPDITFRATRSRDIRAPNLQETFLPANTARQSIFDPFTNTTPAFDQTTTGNRNLKPEKADTLGVGAVFRPSFIEGFSASVDYWSINIKDAISIISAGDVLLLCFDGSNPALCNNVTRVNGVVTQVVSQNINIASQKVRGLDFEATYRKDLDFIGLPGNVDLHANFTRYLEDTIDNGISAPRKALGENSGTNPPLWRTTVSLGYHLDAFRMTVTGRGLSAGKQFANYIECTSNCPASTTDHPTINDNHMPGRFYLDLAFSYDINVGGSKTVTTFLNIRNLTNRDPGLSVTGNAFSNGANAILYDVDGIAFRGGVRFKL
ncbi:TonB-dependent receptor [Sphingomonas sp. BIUV-7]|uniref:TonB-dependent receptor n=1 Tax=Sphingomonas natans TaxID=3063330 RepID=A0ABT8Y847_9SPHN|nr:TonB-dependent receptor [Sphingomonas sp. BIUV-7]MDO6414058.1 TonB-dependent receptor [Sphingomonas sp. BIUV-7]